MALKVKDIANMLGVSPATVSLVINNKPGISNETREKVLKKLEEMGYNPFSLSKARQKEDGGKSIRFVIYKKHGRVVAETPFFSELMEGIDIEARKNGYDLVISYINEKENMNQVLSIIKENPLCGIILLATEMYKDDLKPFIEINVPIVILDSYFQGKKIDTVVINNVQGAYEATKHLIDMGHKKIGYLHSSVWINNFDERMEGLKKALANYNIVFDSKYTFSLDSTLDGAYRDMKKILTYNPPLPTAFFADNDIIAFGALKALKEAGYNIPEDISVVGFDDMPICDMMEPPLTTIRVYKQRMGMIAVKRLLENVNNNTNEFIKIEIGTDLIERKSVLKNN